MTDYERYGWEIVRNPRDDNATLCIVDGDRSDASTVADQNNGHTVGDRVRIVRSRGAAH